MPGLIIEPDDVCLYVTEKCNSNCIMCPMSIHARQRGNSIDNEYLINFEDIPYDDTAHFTITGGEPFLEYQKTIYAMSQINQKYPNAEILVLTNGRALAIDKIFELIKPEITDRYCFAVPIHASSYVLHDRITNSAGSFNQTIRGLMNLSESEARIEIRIVGNKLNIHDIVKTYKMLATACFRVDLINLIAMEMTGCAAANRKALWVDYGELALKAEKGIQFAMMHGIDVGLYNFPLCTIPERLWPLAKTSINPSKIRFYEVCNTCAVREACGGLFYSTYELNYCPVTPIKKD